MIIFYKRQGPWRGDLASKDKHSHWQNRSIMKQKRYRETDQEKPRSEGEEEVRANESEKKIACENVILCKWWYQRPEKERQSLRVTVTHFTSQAACVTSQPLNRLTFENVTTLTPPVPVTVQSMYGQQPEEPKLLLTKRRLWHLTAPRAKNNSE